MRVAPLFLIVALGTSPGAPAADAPSAVSFANDVMPILSSAGCNATACHGASDGKGGLKLSLFGADPIQDYVALAKADRRRRVNVVEPHNSLLLLKGAGALEHGGKQAIPPGSPQYEVLAAWLAHGAPVDAPNAAKLVAIAVEPTEMTLRKEESRAITATAEFSDGTRRDVTHNALFRALDASVAAAAAGGQVAARGFGQTHVVVTFNRRAAVVRVAVPQPLPQPIADGPVQNKLDELVLVKLKELGIPPSEPCSDGEFLRRVRLDTTGQLPSADEIRRFLADADPAKRSKLIDHLLESGEFADFAALKWGDLLRIKSEYPSNLWPNAVQATHAWVWESVAKNKPYDQFVRELLVSSGSNFREPTANFYRAMKKREPQGFAEATSLVFLGVRLDCVSCHGHPTESWTLEDNLGMAAFFAQVKFKGTKEWKEEIVLLDPGQALRDPRTKNIVPPKFLDGESPKLVAGEDPRARLAAWLTAPENPYFARNIVNRIWFWLLGRGIVQEPDDMRPTNPASNPALLDFLANELTANKFDLKHIYRLILNSAAYQRSSLPNAWNRWDVVFCSHYPMRRLTAEQADDAIGAITLNRDRFASQIPEPYSHWPSDFHAVQLADGSVSTPFLELFGRPPRDTAYESDRDCRGSMRQALYLITSADLEGRIAKSPRIEKWLKDNLSDQAIIDELFLMAYARLPSEDQRKAAEARLAADPKKRQAALQDLMWAVLNTKEFLFNH